MTWDSISSSVLSMVESDGSIKSVILMYREDRNVRLPHSDTAMNHR